MRIGIIGGTGLYSLLANPESIRVDTPWGNVDIATADHPDDPHKRLFFLNRHGDGHRLPAHRIDHRRHIQAMASCRVDAVVAVHNVGALSPQLPAGGLVVPDDQVDRTHRPDRTFFDGPAVHIDFSRPYCDRVRRALIDAATDWPAGLQAHGTYVGVEGPRLETPAEARLLAEHGDIIGMTGCPEAALARERGLCYASLSFVANAAAGGSDANAIQTAMSDQAEAIGRIVLAAAGSIGPTCPQDCQQAATLGRIS